jgi:hypothetical protein
LAVKGHQYQLTDAKGFQQFKLLLWKIEAQPWFTMKDFTRVRPEAHHGGNRIEVISCRNRLNYPPVARVKAIEAAQRHGCGSAGLLW